MCWTKRKASWGQLLLCTSSPLWTSYVNMRIALLLPPWHRQEAESKLSTMGPRAAALPPTRPRQKWEHMVGRTNQLLKWRFNPFSHCCCSCVMGKPC